MESLTERQRQVLKIFSEAEKRGENFPSIRDIAKKLGVNLHAIQGHIEALQKKGWIQKQSSFGLTESAKSDPCTFPLVATIPAGIPIEAFDQSDKTIQFSHDYFGKGSLKAVTISGDSMSGDAIRDGDIGIIQLQSAIGKDDILVVRVEKSEVTLKRVRKKRNMVELVPSNPKYKVRELHSDDVEILGKLVGVVRKA
jgi:repressor LexA